MARHLKLLCAIDPMRSGVTCFFIHSPPNLPDKLVTIGGLRLVTFLENCPRIDNLISVSSSLDGVQIQFFQAILISKFIHIENIFRE